MGGLACKEKIILNGGTIRSELEYLCGRISLPTITIPDDAGYKMVEMLNAAEDLIFKAKRVYLESQGFTGPWPHALS
jgi:hypothetical protein